MAKEALVWRRQCEGYIKVFKGASVINNEALPLKLDVGKQLNEVQDSFAMAPAQPNVDICEDMAQIKMRPNVNELKSEIELADCENNNKVNKCDDKDNDEFDIAKYEAMEFVPQIRWPDFIVQLTLHLVSLYGIYLVLTNKLQFYTLIFVIITVYSSGFGITAGVHRLWSHKAYKARLPLRIVLALLFTITGQRDVYTWALDHRVHHKYTETVADPHDVRRGFWFAHVGWLFYTPHPAVVNRRIAIKECCKDLLDDPVVKYQKMFFIPLFAVLNVILPIGIPMYFWGEEFVNCFVVSFVMRFTTTLNIAFCVNSVAHLWGNKPYDRFIKSVENTYVSLAALGEGWHNYHHVFPWDYRASELGRINPSTMLIDLFAKLGWAYDLKSASPAMILSRAKRAGDGSAILVEEPYPEQDTCIDKSL